ncbi:MAG: GNAT family N-acetyltransferase [Mycolicibacterium cosmeticum]|nr:GNAT family N-acetyltransferase [Mycolicibacterium cosmeticum]
MTLVHEARVGSWSAAPLTPLDFPAIADFVATTPGIAGRKFAADSRDIAEQLGGAFPGAAVAVRDESQLVRGYAALHPPHGLQPEFLAEFVFDPGAPPAVIGDAVDGIVARFRLESATIPGAFLRSFVGTDQQAALDGLIRHGAAEEGRFIRTRKSLDQEDVEALQASALPGYTYVSWPEVLAQGLAEQVRQLQYDTFLEHFGNMSKTPEIFAQHIKSRAFTPDFSNAVINADGLVVGYVLGSTYSHLTGGSVEERSAHTDYIGVRRDQRKAGIGEFLLRKVWLAALRRGLKLASLGTDINNASKAHLLYERLGYVAVEHQSAYRIDSEGSTE